MCGICGIVAPGRPPEVEAVESMAALLDHRGPDGDGSFSADGVALGFRRLAIIDLSDAGRQPFASSDESLQLVHNGEIYNYRELRRELEAKGHRFRSATDTEVVLAAYEEWGERCVERFNGMWAFALWDGRRRRLVCSRDRFGVKPFYYRYAGGRLVFASEPQAFRADPEARLAANPAVVRAYLDHGDLEEGDETFYVGIRRLPPAHMLILDGSGLRLRRYWSLEQREPPVGDAAEAVRELLLDSVRLRLRSDVRVGSCLSGGLDSSAVTVVVDHLLRTEEENARSIGGRQNTFTAFFDDAGFDERPFAEAVVERTESDAHWVSFSDDDLVSNLGRIVEAQGEPFGSTSIAAQWYVMRAAKQAGCIVMLDGQGGDETLAGYHGEFGFRFADLLLGGRIGELRAEVDAYRSLHRVGARNAVLAVARGVAPDLLRWAARSRRARGGQMSHPDLRDVGGSPHAQDESPFRDRLRRQLQLILSERILPRLLRFEDRNSMTHSLEARLPFLDYRLVELLFSLPGSELIHRGHTKVVLRRAVGDLLPPTVRGRVDKLGFVTPEARFFRRALGDLAGDVFASHSFAERGFVDAAYARNRLTRHRTGQLDAGFELWRALNVELWAQAFLDG